MVRETKSPAPAEEDSTKDAVGERPASMLWQSARSKLMTSRPCATSGPSDLDEQAGGKIRFWDLAKASLDAHGSVEDMHKAFEADRARRLQQAKPSASQMLLCKEMRVLSASFVRFDWSSLHLTKEDLKPLTATGDDIADDVAIDFAPSKTRNIFPLFMDANSKGPSHSRQLHDALTQVPDWVDWEQVDRGQAVFWRYVLPLVVSLLFVGLLPGFGDPVINAVLLSTGYLTGARAYARLRETLHFFVQVMAPGGMKYKQPGWEACVRVRLLHSRMRLRLISSQAIGHDSVPICQLQMLVTALSFAVGPLKGLDAIGVRMSAKDKEDFLHAVRVMAWLMGVQEGPLALMQNVQVATAAYESIILHVIRPDASLPQVLRNILLSMQWQFPFYSSFNVLSAMARRMLGNTFSDAAGLSRPTWAAAAVCRLLFAFIRCVVLPQWLAVRVRPLVFWLTTRETAFTGMETGRAGTGATAGAAASGGCPWSAQA